MLVTDAEAGMLSHLPRMLDVATNASYCLGINGIFCFVVIHKKFVCFEPLPNVYDTYVQPL